MKKAQQMAINKVFVLTRFRGSCMKLNFIPTSKNVIAGKGIKRL
ncbi:hypothetical protein ACT691_07465 [Vibrio metschnikovii]